MQLIMVLLLLLWTWGLGGDTLGVGVIQRASRPSHASRFACGAFSWGSSLVLQVRYLVLDEADKLFDMGFMEQVRPVGWFICWCAGWLMGGAWARNV